jgi:predicted house-cleaning noncanonical NTP pyrophosphatase (MazG superfamily)
MKIQHHKLVRDRIPDIIRNDGGIVHLRILDDDEEYRRRLADKVGEEARELESAKTPADRLKESADLLTVMRALLALDGTSSLQLEWEVVRRRQERGGFRDRVFLESVEQTDVA